MRTPRGFDRQTFEIVEGWPYVLGLLIDMLGTRIGTLVLRRGYGSDIPAFVDAPGDRVRVLAMLADLAIACDRIRDLETGEPVVRFSAAQEMQADRGGRYGLVCVFDDLFTGTDRQVPLDRLAGAA